ncbi:polyisoprenoid-binding protein [Mesorhizobium soli]|uniref:Polyisoprenoid-binding protein n=2 Tax=Pseudaminobacter soli (ex Li et al. 2025) TaxID=1295366 RepID=A0A2P7SCI0_9HYPH|nr:polyisoprenoid-binding protein [Mesorhizobium soli]
MPKAGAGLALALFCFIGAAQADPLAEAAGEYRIEPSSHIGFRVEKVGGGYLAGDFGQFRGTFRIDGHNIAGSNVDFVVMPASVRTGEARTENLLRSDAIFDVDAYPEIVFRSTSVRQTGPSSAIIEGNLTARGKTNRAAFVATVGQHSDRNITFHVQGTISRSDYGMDAGLSIYSNLVDFDMQLRGTR